MMKRFFTISYCLMVVFALNAQTTDGLIGYHNFNDSTANELSGATNNGIIVGDTVFACGPEGVGYSLDGELGNHVVFGGIVTNFFERDDLTFASLCTRMK